MRDRENLKSTRAPQTILRPKSAYSVRGREDLKSMRDPEMRLRPESDESVQRLGELQECAFCGEASRFRV